MIDFNKRNIRAWSIMGINPSIWSVGFAEVANSTQDFSVFTADLMRYSGLERIFNKYPDRCYNVGIAEQNMIGIAAGVAMQGTQTFMTTYAPFMTLRCADQVRHLMGNMNLNMKAIGSAAGVSAGLSGSSLLAINDIAFVRSIPNMVVLSPADCTEAIKMIIAMSKSSSPTYMRFCGATKIPIVYQGDYEYEIGKAVMLNKGSRIAIIATGTNVVFNSIEAAKRIKTIHNLNITVVNMHTIKPLDKECVESLACNHDYIITVEEHNVIGGLGSAVAEVLSTISTSCRQVFVGIEDKNYLMGSRSFMLEQAGLTAEKIINKVESLL